jgi:thioredoxin-dependent peroxiredoxin
MAAHPDVGDPAPDFTLPSTEGPLNLYERLREGAALLVFYPKDDTLVCTRQLCNYRDHLSEFRAVGVELIGINHDDLASHAAFASRHRLPFPLCSDEKREVCRAYGALPHAWNAKRVAVLVGEDARIWWRFAELRLFHRDAKDLLQVIQELRAAR